MAKSSICLCGVHHLALDVLLRGKSSNDLILSGHAPERLGGEPSVWPTGGRWIKIFIQIVIFTRSLFYDAWFENPALQI